METLGDDSRGRIGQDRWGIRFRRSCNCRKTCERECEKE